MKRSARKLATTFAVIAMAIVASGCPDSGTTEPGPTSTETEENDHGHSHADGEHAHADDHSEHDHSAADHSPKHGGHLIELGHDHEYHAELADDHAAHTVTVYMMDSHMEPLTISQASVELVLTDDTMTATFELLANAPGGSSEFASSEPKLLDLLEKDGVKGKLRVTIEGTPYSGEVSHDGHAHGDSEDGEGEDPHAGHDHD